MNSKHIVNSEKTLNTPLQYISLIVVLLLWMVLANAESRTIQNIDALILSAGLLALADVLAGSFSSGLWSGYILFAGSMGWAVDGISGAIFTIIIGFAGSVVVRVLLANRLKFESYSSQSIVNDFIARLVTVGIGVVLIDVVYKALGGTVPINVFEAQNILPILVAFTAGILGVYASGLLLLTPSVRQEVLPKLFWRSGKPIQFVQEYVLLLLVPSIVVVYFNFNSFLFFIAMLAIAAQGIRYKLFAGVKESLEHRVDELVMLDTISRDIVSNIAMDGLLRKIYEYISQLTPVSTFTIALYDDSTEIISFPLIMQDNKDVRRQECHIDHIPIIVKLERLRKPLEIGLYQQGEERLEWHDTTEAFLAYPLHVGEKFIGAICLSSATNSDFGTDEKRIILTISTQVSLVLRNAILFERSVSTSQKLARIYQFVQEVVLNNDRGEIFLRSAEVINSLFDSKSVAFFARDIENDKFVMAYSHALDTVSIDSLNKWVNSQTTIGNIVTYADLATSSDSLLKQFHQETGYGTITGIMLQSSSIHEGLLVVLHSHAHHYNVYELDILKTLGLQISAALDNADLLHALESYASEQAQLVLFSRTLTASLDIEVVVEDIQQALSSMLSVDTVAIGLSSDDTLESLDFRVCRGDKSDRESKTITNHIVFDNSMPIIITSSESDNNARRFLQELDVADDVMIAPLIANQKLLGMIVVASQRSFTSSDIRFLELASNHAATHIHTVQQYNYIEYALEKRLQQLAMIEDIAKNISATLDVNQLIEHVLEAAIQATQADVAVLGLVTEHEQLVTHGRYFDNGSWNDLDFVQSINEGTMGQVAQTGSPVLLYRNANSAEYLSIVEDKNYLSSIVVPLGKDDQIRGVINLESLQESFFNTDHLEFISSLADHAVISLQNTHLLNERQQQINTLTQLRKLSLVSIGAKSQKVITDAVIDTALEIIPADFATSNILDAETTELIDTTIRAKHSGQVNHLDVFVPENVLEATIAQSKVLYIADVHKSELYQDFWNIKDIAYNSLIAIPLTDQDGNNKQVLCLLFRQIQANLESFAHTIELLSIQASSFLQNANLYEQILSGNNRMTAILDATSNGIVLLDRNGRLLQTNPSAERILDMSLYEFVGENFMNVILHRLQEVSAFASEEAREGLQKMARVLRLEPERITRQEYALPHRDGSQIYVEEIGSPVMSSDYEIIGRLLVIRDMTEQKQLESYRDEVTQMVIHDLRSPLGTILGSLAVSLDIIKDPQGIPIEDAVIPALDVSVATTERLLRLVDSILDISKLENRSMPLNLQPSDIKDVIQSAAKSMQRSLDESNIQLSIKNAEDLPQVVVDTDKIERVIINLLDNALRYTPRGGQVQIETESLQKGKFVLVRIADSGPGIPEDQQEKVFAKYSQVKGAKPQRGNKGTGLGLTFCKLTVETHGGSIRVEPSGPLSGASFAFTLPAQ